MRKIFCCGCGRHVQARLTNGSEIYAHRRDLHSLPFWKCDVCGNYVGCHHKTRNPTKPLGCIPTQAVRNARSRVHSLLDRLWEFGSWGRSEVYAELSRRLGWKYHTANIRSVAEAEKVCSILRTL